MRNLQSRAYQKIKLLGIATAALVGLTTVSLANPTEIARIKQIEPSLYDFIYKHTDYDPQWVLPVRMYVFKPQEELNAIYYGREVEAGDNLQVQALYKEGVVFLRDDFTVRADAFVLLHELVHHVQHSNGAQFECPAEQEREAYEVMDKYVEVSGNGEKTDPFFKLLMVCRPELGWQ